MLKTELMTLLNKFESAVAAARSYDTMLDFQESSVSISQGKKSDLLHEKYKLIKKQIEELLDAQAS